MAALLLVAGTIMTAICGGLVSALLSAVAATFVLDVGFVAPIGSISARGIGVPTLASFFGIGIVVAVGAYWAAQRAATSLRARNLERAQSLAASLLRSAGHDLRAPVASLRINLETLASASTPEEVAQAQRRALASLSKLQAMIESILDASRIDAGMVRPRVAQIDLATMLTAFETTRVRVDVDPACRLETDAGLVMQVVTNLVANAVRVSHQVEVTGMPRADGVDIAVVDHGPGVPSPRRERMFTPYERLDEAAPGGLGLGLAIAAGLAQALEGEIVPTETPGGGLTMTLRLPRTLRV